MNFELFSLQGMKRKSSQEWAGPCPMCGGKDRFTLKEDAHAAGNFRWFCRQCAPLEKNHWKDAIDLYRHLHPETTFQEAAHIVGASDRIKLARQKGSSHIRNRQPNRALSSARQVVSKSAIPNEQWRNMAAKFMAQCQKCFDLNFETSGKQLPSIDAIQYLFAGRALNPDTCLQCGIGYNDRTIYPLRTTWGLKEEDRRTKIKLPRGIVIAIRRKGYGICALVIRRLQEDIDKEGGNKFQEVASDTSHTLAYGIGRSGQSVIICESALDAALVWQESQGQWAAIATMGSGKRLDQDALAIAEAAPYVLISYDNDDAGFAAIAAIRRQLPFAIPVACLGGKDLTEMHLNINAGMPVGIWLSLAHEKARQIKK